MASSMWVARDASIESQETVNTYMGGMRLGKTGIASWSYPLARLTLYSDGLVVGPSRSVLRLLLIPVWKARFDEIQLAESIGGPQPDAQVSPAGLFVPFSTFTRYGLFTRGVRFRTHDGSYVIFWCFKRDNVLAALKQLGLAVDIHPKRFHWFDPVT